jgi:TetR/AcrR family transcriptional regulator
MHSEKPDSRESIEAAAAEEFREFGFHGARIDRIARRSGLNKQLIYYYFGSKQKLYDHILKNAALQLRLDAAARRTLPTGPAERLRSLLERSLGHAAATPDIMRAAVLDPTSPQAGAPLRELADEFAREISRGQGLGHYRDDADPATVGTLMAMMVFGWVMTAPVFSQDAADPRKWAESLAGTLGRALTW